MSEVSGNEIEKRGTLRLITKFFTLPDTKDT